MNSSGVQAWTQETLISRQNESGKMKPMEEQTHSERHTPHGGTRFAAVFCCYFINWEVYTHSGQ